MVIQANGKEYHSVEIQLGSVLIPKDKIESEFFAVKIVALFMRF